MFLQNGGAKEVPASQVVQLRWHIEPPVAGTVFPQYESVKDEVLHFMCDEGGCDREFWFLSDDMETASACLDHLRRNHEYKFAEARAVLAEQNIVVRSQRARIERVRVTRDDLEDED